MIICMCQKTVDRLVDEMTDDRVCMSKQRDKMPVDKMTADKIPLDKMYVDEMTGDNMHVSK